MSYISNKDVMLEIAKGNIAGHSSVNKFGANADIGEGTSQEVWDGSADYVFPTSAVITHISQKANQAAMRGATMEVQGLNANWELIVQTKALNASDSSTIVELDTPLIRVFRVKVLTDVVGNQGISAHNAANDKDYAIITAGKNQTGMAIYTVPAGKTAYMVQYWGSGVESTNKEPKSVDFSLWTADRANGYEFQYKHSKASSKGAPDAIHEFKPYMRINEKTDIKILAAPSNEDASVHAGFDLVLVDNA